MIDTVDLVFKRQVVFLKFRSIQRVQFTFAAPVIFGNAPFLENELFKDTSCELCPGF